MRASSYHEEWGGDEFMDKLSEYTLTYPIADEALADLDWATPEDEIFFYEDLEDLTGAEIPDNVLDGALGGELKVAQLSNSLLGLVKEARISTQQEKSRAKIYRMANKAKIARSAKRRRRRQKGGMQLKRKRVGSAAGGYSFIAAAPSVPNTAASSPKAAPTSGINFAPKINTGSTQKVHNWKAL